MSTAAIPRAVIVLASDIQPKHMKYLWPGKVGIGCTTIYYGMPEQGKSSQALDVAARISIGAKWPNSASKAPEGSTLLIAHEDAISEVIIWRYKAMKGDRSKLHFLKGIQRSDTGYLDWLDITRDLPLIEDEIKKIEDLKLLIIDPISAYFGKKDINKISEVRATLGPLNTLVQKYELAKILIHHCNKNTLQDTLHRMSGSTAFGDFARQAWQFGSREENKTRKLMVSAKNSYGPPATGLAFSFVQVDPAERSSVKLVYEAVAIQESAQEIFFEKKRPVGRPAKERGQAAEFLREILADGPVPRKRVKDLAELRSIEERTLQRTVSDMEIKKIRPKKGEHKGQICWQMRQN